MEKECDSGGLILHSCTKWRWGLHWISSCMISSSRYIVAICKQRDRRFCWSWNSQEVIIFFFVKIMLKKSVGNASFNINTLYLHSHIVNWKELFHLFQQLLKLTTMMFDLWHQKEFDAIYKWVECGPKGKQIPKRNEYFINNT